MEDAQCEGADTGLSNVAIVRLGYGIVRAAGKATASKDEKDMITGK